MNIINKFLHKFKREDKVAEVKLPEVGEVWYLRDGSPWVKMNCPAKILDVRDGWVRYKLNDIIYQDERMQIKSFVSCYQYVPQHERAA